MWNQEIFQGFQCMTCPWKAKISSMKVIIFVDPAIFKKTALSLIQVCRVQEREMKRWVYLELRPPVCETIEWPLGSSFAWRWLCFHAGEDKSGWPTFPVRSQMNSILSFTTHTVSNATMHLCLEQRCTQEKSGHGCVPGKLYLWNRQRAEFGSQAITIIVLTCDNCVCVWGCLFSTHRTMASSENA